MSRCVRLSDESRGNTRWGISDRKQAIWLTDEVWEQVKHHYQQDDCTAQNEFMEKALRFYIDYLNTENAAAYLPEAFDTTLEEKPKPFANRISSLLFKIALKQNMQNHLLAGDLDMDEKTYVQLRKRCILKFTSP